MSDHRFFPPTPCRCDECREYDRRQRHITANELAKNEDSCPIRLHPPYCNKGKCVGTPYVRLIECDCMTGIERHIYIVLQDVFEWNGMKYLWRKLGGQTLGSLQTYPSPESYPAYAIVVPAPKCLKIGEPDLLLFPTLTLPTGKEAMTLMHAAELFTFFKRYSLPEKCK